MSTLTRALCGLLLLGTLCSGGSVRAEPASAKVIGFWRLTALPDNKELRRMVQLVDLTIKMDYKALDKLKLAPDEKMIVLAVKEALKDPASEDAKKFKALADLRTWWVEVTRDRVFFSFGADMESCAYRATKDQAPELVLQCKDDKTGKGDTLTFTLQGADRASFRMEDGTVALQRAVRPANQPAPVPAKPAAAASAQEAPSGAAKPAAKPVLVPITHAKLGFRIKVPKGHTILQQDESTITYSTPIDGGDEISVHVARMSFPLEGGMAEAERDVGDPASVATKRQLPNGDILIVKKPGYASQELFYYAVSKTRYSVVRCSAPSSLLPTLEEICTSLALLPDK